MAVASAVLRIKVHGSRARRQRNMTHILFLQLVLAAAVAHGSHLSALDTSMHAPSTVPADPKAARLQAGIVAAIRDGRSSFDIAQGDYEFGAAPLMVNNATDLLIRCQPGVTLWFSVGGGVQIKNSIGVTFMGCTIDYTATLAQGTVVDFSAALPTPYFTADFDARFLLPDPNIEPFFFNGGTVKVAFFDPDTLQMIRVNASAPAAINLFASNYSNVTTKGPPAGGTRRYKVQIKGNLAALPATLNAGTPVAVFPRGGSHSLLVMNGTRIKVHQCNIFGGSSMGIVDSNGGGGNAYTEINMTRRPALWADGAVRYLSVNADGFHSTTNDVGPTIDRTQIAYTGDDLGNICCAMTVLLSSTPRADGKPGADVLFVDVGGNMLLYGAVGNSVAFYNITDADGFGTVQLASAPTQATDSNSVQLMRAAFATITAPPYNVHFVNEVEHHFMTGFPVKASLSPLLLDERSGRSRGTNTKSSGRSDNNIVSTVTPKPSHAVDVAGRGGSGSSVEMLPVALWSVAILESTDNSGASVTRSNFHDGYARAFMIKGRDAVYDGSTWARAGGIHIGPEINWLEGDPGIHNVTVSNNRLTAVGDPAIQVDNTVKSGGIILTNNTETI